jgi:16S rRNA (guanine527-N7)-methyltransferase
MKKKATTEGEGRGLLGAPADPFAALDRGLTALGIAVTPGQRETLVAYYREILFWNERYGLVNAQGVELVVKHFLDSLAPLSLIAGLVGTTSKLVVPRTLADAKSEPAAVRTLADAGSGAGFPGIPLAIMLPEVRVSLIERSGRRVRFLENVVLMLGLHNVTIQEKGIEDATGGFDVVTFRAFRPLEPDIYRALSRLRSVDGALVAYKGRMEAIRLELSALASAAPGLIDTEDVKTEPLSVPFLDEERNLVILRRNTHKVRISKTHH